MTLILIIIILVFLFGGGGYYGYRGGYYGGGGISLVGLLLLIIILFLLFGGHSWAATDATTNDGRVGISWLWEDLKPYILQLWAAIIGTFVVPWLVYVAHKFLGIKVTEKDQATFQQAALNAAGRVLAQVDGPISNIKFDVHSPEIAREITRIQQAIPDSLNRIGASPDKVANAVLGKLGQLQAGTVPVLPVAKP